MLLFSTAGERAFALFWYVDRETEITPISLSIRSLGTGVVREVHESGSWLLARGLFIVTGSRPMMKIFSFTPHPGLIWGTVGCFAWTSSIARARLLVGEVVSSAHHS